MALAQATLLRAKDRFKITSEFVGSPLSLDRTVSDENFAIDDVNNKHQFRLVKEPHQELRTEVSPPLVLLKTTNMYGYRPGQKILTDYSTSNGLMVEVRSVTTLKDFVPFPVDST